jgi:NCS2 family nucleobase:cation symporter-2
MGETDMKKPPNLIYGVEEKPPLLVTAFNGAQHVALIAINFVYPLVIFRAAGTPIALVGDMLSVGILVLGIGTVLQARRLGPMGSGYMCPATFTATYLAPSLVAARIGGLPLLFGMTACAGLFEAAIAPLLNRMRSIFPPEVSGLVILLIGLSAGISGVRLMLAPNAPPVTDSEWAVIAITLAAMVSLNVWGKGLARMLCALIGVVVGYIAAATAGLLAGSFSAVLDAPWIGLPLPHHLAWSFDPALIAPFAITAVAAALKAAGTIAVCQRMNDADWVRPEMKTTVGGVLADGVSTAVAGAFGAVGTNTSTPAVGLASATGVGSRQVAYAASIIFVMLSFFPKLSALLAIMPRAVMVPAVLFAATFIIINGIQVIASRLLDVRRSLVIGLAMVAGASADIFPTLATSAPKAIAPLVGSSLAFGTVIALLLNLIFRLGVTRKAGFTIAEPDAASQATEEFFAKQGGAWGARPDIIKRATFAVVQLAEAVFENCEPQGPIAVTATFDEFNLDVRIGYAGALLEFPDRRPTDTEIRESDDGVRRLAGFMLRHSADRVRADRAGAQSAALFHFNH